MENLEILSVDTTTQAKETINGQDVIYIYAKKMDEAVKVISFQLPSEVKYENIAEGSFVVSNNQFNFRTLQMDKVPDGIDKVIFARCKAIVEGFPIEEIEETEETV